MTRPLISCPTLPFQPTAFRHPFQKCIYLILAPLLPSFLPSFLPTYLLSGHFFQLVSRSSRTLSRANAAVASSRCRHRGYRTTVSYSAGERSIPSRSVLFQELSVSIQRQTNFPMTQRQSRWPIPFNMDQPRFFSKFYLKTLLLPRFCLIPDRNRGGTWTITWPCFTINSLFLSDTRLRYVDTDDTIGNTNWVLGDLRSLHRCVPALRRTGIIFLFYPPLQ